MEGEVGVVEFVSRMQMGGEQRLAECIGHEY
jgi:hypothetical protein